MIFLCTNHSSQSKYFNFFNINIFLLNLPPSTLEMNLGAFHGIKFKKMHKVKMNRCLSSRYFLLSIVNSMGRACGMGRVT